MGNAPASTSPILRYEPNCVCWYCKHFLSLAPYRALSGDVFARYDAMIWTAMFNIIQ
jgi:hypothetical protein